MAWDDAKQRGDELTSSDWNESVADQKEHSERHQSDGSDELNVSGLSGQLSDAQKVEVAESLIDTLETSGLLSVEVVGETATINIENTDIDHNETSNRTHDGDTLETVTQVVVDGVVIG